MDIKKKLAIAGMGVLPVLGGGIAFASVPSAPTTPVAASSTQAGSGGSQQGPDTAEAPEGHSPSAPAHADADGPGGPNVQQGPNAQQGPDTGGPDAGPGAAA